MSTSPREEGSRDDPHSPGRSDSAEPQPPSTPGETIAETPAAADDLPEWEPLSPEIVEDEAIRGDFVMRWAVVGLAILLGCSQIAETKTLVHIRSGEYLAQHGFLPPAKDYLAFTRTDQPWVNLSWLFDLVAAAKYHAGGGMALSLFQAVIAAIIFALLVHTVRPGIRTWWGSVCAAFALLACFRHFTIQPELITLLGVALTVWLLIRSQEGSATKEQWALIPVIWIWSQMDSRAFLGWGLLLLYGLGELIGSLLGRPGFTDSRRRTQFWTVTGLSVLAAGLHPFTWHAWTSPFALYGVEYPAWREAYPIPTRAELGAWPIWDQRFRFWLNHEGVAGLYLMVAAFVTMALNYRRVAAAHLAMFLGINAAAVVATHELAAASLVNCVLATLNAQEWFLARYGQTYSIEWTFLAFSRGGRAVTVFALFALAYLTISGRIDGANGKRTGLGFDEDLQSLMTGYVDVVNDSYDDRPFPFVVRQGDLLIWAGQKSFIDSRLELFYPGGDSSLYSLHIKTRAALRSRQSKLEGAGDRAHWRKVFDQYQITHVVVRMSGLSITPNYKTFDDLQKSFDWKLTGLTSAAAVFYRTDLRQDRELREYVDRRALDMTDLAFREEATPVTEPQVWPTSVSDYQKTLSPPKMVVPGDATLAAHYIHLGSLDQARLRQQIAALQLAVRSARAALRENPNSAEAYRTLGTAYAVLDQLENFELRRHGVAIPHLLRYYQISSAYQTSLRLEPNDPFLHQEVAGLYERVGKPDLMLRHLKELERLRPPVTKDLEEKAEQQLAAVNQLVAKLEDGLAALQGEIDSRLQQGEHRITTAMFAYQNNAVLTAIKTLEDDKVALAQSTPAQILLSGWLIEAGRVEEADQMLRSMEQRMGIEQTPGWRDNAVYAAWAQGDYGRVAKLYEDAVAAGEQRRVTASLMTGPLTAVASPVLPADRYPWMHLLSMQDVAGVRAMELGTHLTCLALCRLEQGDLPAAKAALQQVFDSAPDNLYRPLQVLYWNCLTGEQLDIEPPNDWIPLTNDAFAEEKAE